MSWPDQEAMVRAAQTGDRAAFDALHRDHLAAVYRLVLFQVRQRSLAEDICQEVFLSAYRGLGELREPARFRLWLMRIAQNRIRNHWRDLSRRPAGPPAVEPPEAASDDDPRARAEQIMLEQDVQRAMEHLTRLQRQVITLRFIAGLSAAETAQIMDRSENAVHNLQHHGLAALRRLLVADRGADR